MTRLVPVFGSTKPKLNSGHSDQVARRASAGWMRPALSKNWEDTQAGYCQASSLRPRSELMLTIARWEGIVSVGVPIANPPVLPMNDYFRVLMLGDLTCRANRLGLGLMSRGVARVSRTADAPSLLTRDDMLVLSHEWLTDPL